MTTRFKILALAGVCLSLTLTGCGRKGPLDDPSSPPPQAAGVEAEAEPAVVLEPDEFTPPESDKPFFLDFLIK